VLPRDEARVSFMPGRRAWSSVRHLLAVGGLVGLLAGWPRPGRAEIGHAVDPWSWVTPEDHALTGGIARLRSPASRMIRIPRGEFWMGSTDEEVVRAAADCTLAVGARLRDDAEHDPCGERLLGTEIPRHRVRLSSFWLDRTEVTVADYQRCVTVGRCAPIPLARGARRFDQPTLPASLVTFGDAEGYCRQRGARLPTEAEFERAARGPSGRQYPWGESFNGRAANHGRFGMDRTDARDGFAELAPVGALPAGRTPEGLLDLAGNVAEWVGDLFGAYAPGLSVDPTGPHSPLGVASPGIGTRMVRGGDYQSPPPMLRGAARRPADPLDRRPWVGFRCARSERDLGPSER
jgi:sulfatase modifying factor 1